MINNVLEYKGYRTKIEFDTDTQLLHGKIEGIGDLINFESDSASEIIKEFYNAVDDYLEFCREIGKEPDKEYKGVFNVRIPPELHRDLVICALKKGNSLNAVVTEAIREYLAGNVCYNYITN